MRGVGGPMGYSFLYGVCAALLSASFVFGFAHSAEARKRRPEQPRAAAKEPKGLEKPTQPLLLVVSIPRQRVTVYGGNEKIAEAPVSTGQRGFPTPTGVFTLLQKNRTHFSNLYGGAPMPFMQRVTWSGVALHAGVLPGYPASHGCIRLPYTFARDLFGLTALGARVIITRDEITPAEVVHGKLIAPLPSQTALGEAGPTRTAEAETIEVATTDSGVEPGDTGLLGSMSRIAAVAAGTVRPRTQEEATALRAAELAGHEHAVTAAQAGLKEAQARLEAADAALRAAQTEVKPARIAAEKLGGAAKKAEWRMEAARERLDDLMKAAERRPTPRNLEALAENRTALEETIRAVEAEAAPARSGAGDAARDLEGRVAVAEAKGAERSAAAQAVKAAVVAIKTAEQNLLKAKRAMARRDLPISIFVSRKAGRLYVRQGQEPIAEAPVTIAEAGQLIGTHIFTAIDTASGGSALRWSGVTIPTRVSLDAAKSTKKRKGEKAAVPEEAPAALPLAPPDVQTANAALDRVTFPAETHDLLRELVKPGSSLVISDYEISNETGKYTDFIILTKHPEDPARAKTRSAPRYSSRPAPRRYRRPPPTFFW